MSVSAASEEASTNVGTVAAASEQMSHSIAEVSERVGRSASLTLLNADLLAQSVIVDGAIAA